MSEFLDLSKFSQQSFINKGTFGEVYKVMKNETKEIFAAKISLNKLTEEQKSLITNLKREVDLMSQINHPSILKFIGYSPIDFNSEYKPVIITEYSANGSLAHIMELERRSLSPPLWDDTKKLITLYGISSAMSYLHSHNIIHRDLKPANILEDDFLFPKVADFGLSKMLHTNQDSMTTQSSTGFKGTPIYMAPECWDNNEYSKSTDVYAFAMIAYELLTLEIPFKDFSYVMLCKKVAVNGERPKLTNVINDCYAKLITDCWSQEAEKRPTFDQIKNELKTNKKFITDSIDKDQFFDYVEMIDSINCSFDPSKKFKKITLGKVEEIESNESKSKSRVISEITEKRERKFERKEVCHHEPHSILGKSSRNHTHYTIFHVTKTEQRTVKTFEDGNVEYSEWKFVPENEIKREVGSGMESGFTQEYENEIKA